MNDETPADKKLRLETELLERNLQFAGLGEWLRPASLVPSAAAIAAFIGIAIQFGNAKMDRAEADLAKRELALEKQDAQAQVSRSETLARGFAQEAERRRAEVKDLEQSAREHVEEIAHVEDELCTNTARLAEAEERLGTAVRRESDSAARSAELEKRVLEARAEIQSLRGVGDDIVTKVQSNLTSAVAEFGRAKTEQRSRASLPDPLEQYVLDRLKQSEFFFNGRPRTTFRYLVGVALSEEMMQLRASVPARVDAIIEQACDDTERLYEAAGVHRNGPSIHSLPVEDSRGRGCARDVWAA